MVLSFCPSFWGQQMMEAGQKSWRTSDCFIVMQLSLKRFKARYSAAQRSWGWSVPTVGFLQTQKDAFLLWKAHRPRSCQIAVQANKRPQGQCSVFRCLSSSCFWASYAKCGRTGIKRNCACFLQARWVPVTALPGKRNDPVSVMLPIAMRSRVGVPLKQLPPACVSQPSRSWGMLFCLVPGEWVGFKLTLHWQFAGTRLWANIPQASKITWAGFS